MVLTGGHKVYVSPTDRVEVATLTIGQCLCSIQGDTVFYLPITKIEQLESRQFMFDLTAEDYHNFQLHGNGSVISNSPDRFYHFRPPEAEANIGAYNQVFGQIWEDSELNEYLERALDWFNSMPPMTEGLNTIDKLVMEKPVWRTAILWDAITHACFALATNWVADEFSISSNENVRIYLPDGSIIDVPIGELYDICS